MSDLDDETDTSCGEEQIVSEWEVQKEWLENILTTYHHEPVSSINKSEINHIVPDTYIIENVNLHFSIHILIIINNSSRYQF